MSRRKSRTHNQKLQKSSSTTSSHPTTVVEETIQELSYSGPIPPPEALKLYDTVSAGLAERIFDMAKAEADHRHKMAETSLDADIEFTRTHLNNYKIETRLGQFFALIIGLSAIFGGIYAAVHDAQVTGSLIGTGGVIGLVSVFILGRRQKDSEATEE